MGAFRSVAFVAALAALVVGCGGRTASKGDASGSSAAGARATRGDSAGVTAGSSSGSTSGTTSGSTSGAATLSGFDASSDAGDAQVATECPPTVPVPVLNESPGGACAGNLRCAYGPDGRLLPPFVCPYRVGECVNGEWYGYHVDPGTFPCLLPWPDASTPDANIDGTVRPDAASDAGSPPSCAPGGPGMTNCGPGGIAAESCCTSLEVRGGKYSRTYSWNADAGAPSDLGAPASVSTFRLDKYDVTVGRFRQFVSAVVPADGGAGWLPAPGAGKHTHLNGGNGLAATGGGFEPGWDAADDVKIAPTSANLATGGTYLTWTALAGGHENLPINNVNWWEAYAFCIWDGAFLPSDAEWEYAAAGGAEQREFPWGSTDPGTSNRYAVYNCYYGAGGGASTCSGVKNIAPVGTARDGAGLWGQLDLVGNVEQWNLDWWASNDAYGGACDDCADVLRPFYMNRVIRGGHYSLVDASELLPSFRSFYYLPGRDDHIGFRCARAP